MTDIDTGVFVAPAIRPSAFTPAGTTTMIVRPAAGTDTGVATTPAAIPNTFDDLGAPAVATPGY